MPSPPELAGQDRGGSASCPKPVRKSFRSAVRYTWWWLVPILLTILALWLLVSLRPAGLVPVIETGF
jgi:hypothetical protein